jgi:YesN/AraC family two-component response regulator
MAVLILTGFGALETAQEAIRRGANDYLRKPFDAHEMLATVRQRAQRARLLRRHRETSAELRKINQLLLDELARKNHLAQVGQKSAEFIHDLRNPLTAVLGYTLSKGDKPVIESQRIETSIVAKLGTWAALSGQRKVQRVADKRNEKHHGLLARD